MATPRGPAIPQITSPTRGRMNIKTVHPSFVPELLVLRQTLASAQISRTNTMTADTIQKTEKSML
jgi:hypothetical protein